MATTEVIRARVLVDCLPLGVKAGQVIETTADVIDAHAGELDSNNAAVTYALRAGGSVVRYVPEVIADGDASGGSGDPAPSAPESRRKAPAKRVARREDAGEGGQPDANAEPSTQADADAQPGADSAGQSVAASDAQPAA